MIFTRRFGALAARPQFPDAPELQQEQNTPIDLDAELARLTAGDNRVATDGNRVTADTRRNSGGHHQADESAA
ncbi:hypothetical protein [Kribbella swartbergensis]